MRLLLLRLKVNLLRVSTDGKIWKVVVVVGKEIVTNSENLHSSKKRGHFVVKNRRTKYEKPLKLLPLNHPRKLNFFLAEKRGNYAFPFSG